MGKNSSLSVCKLVLFSGRLIVIDKFNQLKSVDNLQCVGEEIYIGCFKGS